MQEFVLEVRVQLQAQVKVERYFIESQHRHKQRNQLCGSMYQYTRLPAGQTRWDKTLSPGLCGVQHGMEVSHGMDQSLKHL